VRQSRKISNSFEQPLGVVNSPVPVERLSQGLSNYSYRTAGSTGANKNCRSPPSGRIYYAQRSRQAALSGSKTKVPGFAGGYVTHLPSASATAAPLLPPGGKSPSPTEAFHRKPKSAFSSGTNCFSLKDQGDFVGSMVTVIFAPPNRDFEILMSPP